jgi:hypothetical protein
LNRQGAKYAKKAGSQVIVQNRETVLDKAAFQFAVTRQIEIRFSLAASVS